MSTLNWPALSYAEGKATYETMHLWTQIMGKIKLAKLPWINHSWHVTLAVTPEGLCTGDIPDGKTHFQLVLDLLRHELRITTDGGLERSFVLQGTSVAAFYRNILACLGELNIAVRLNTLPNELVDPTPFDRDTEHAGYDPEQAQALHRALLNSADLFTQFRADFIGKCSPVHFFWGGFDLAVSRFSGRTAPLHPGGVPNLPDRVAREAYSHEVSSCGFWPGNAMLPEAAFYSYIYPAPPGFSQAGVQPPEAYYHQTLQEFILPYEAVRQAADPSAAVLAFINSTYAAAANLAAWDRAALEKPELAYAG